MAEVSRLRLRFGALSEPIGQQLYDGYGIHLGASESTRFQASADAITRLNLESLLTDAEVRRARQRLLKRIHKAALAKSAVALSDLRPSEPTEQTNG